MKEIFRRGLAGINAFRGRSKPGRHRAGARSSLALSAAVEPLEQRFLLSASPVIHPDDANGVPPTASISAPEVTSSGASSETVSITLTDSAGIDPGSITNDNITVTNVTTGAVLTVTASALNPSDGSGTTDIATYSLAAPDASGFFSSADNGTYDVLLGLNQIYDPDGDEAAGASGSFVVDVAAQGVLPPAATITPPATVTTAVPSVNVTVTYLATAGNGDLINVGTINTGNITVTGPHGTLAVSSVTINPTSDAASVTATYVVAAPSGVFTTANDGVHTITLNSNEPVQDTEGSTAITSATASTFAIEVPSALLATITAPTNVTVAQPSETVSIVYTDASGINLSTITASNIQVTEQGVTNPTPLTITGVTLSPSAGTPTAVTATYTIAAPDGEFSLTNNGTYTVTFQDNQVEDVNGVFAITTSSSFIVQVPGSSSLIPGLAGAKLPAAVATGTPLRLTIPIAVTDRGTIASGGTSTVILYLSSTQTLAGATEVAHVNAGLHLKVNKSKTVKIKLASLPTSLATGAYYLLAQVIDHNGNSQITASSAPLSVSPAFIDLSGALQPLPAVLKPGKKTSATVTVTNDGNVAAPGTLQVEFYARPAGTTGIADVPLATPGARINLAAGSSKRIRYSFALPATLTAGTDYTMVAVLDPANLFHDSNLANNTIVGAYIFTVDPLHRQNMSAKRVRISETASLPLLKPNDIL